MSSIENKFTPAEAAQFTAKPSIEIAPQPFLGKAPEMPGVRQGLKGKDSFGLPIDDTLNNFWNSAARFFAQM
jgi:hypothetical protein